MTKNKYIIDVPESIADFADVPESIADFIYKT